MNTSEYDKSIGMPDIDKEWAKFENEVINSKSGQHKMPIPPIIEIEDDRT